MQAQFVAQPLSSGSTLHRFLAEVLADPDLTSLDIVVAWAKASGLRRIEEELKSFRQRGGTSRLLVGIDEGGATSQGLRAALALFDTVYVLHDRSRRTFHPKLYCADGPATSRLFIGSNNLTAGGTFFNYEAGLAVELALSDAADRALREQVQQYVDALYDDHEIVINLNADSVATLEADSRYRIQDEASSRRSEDLEDTDTSTPDTPEESAANLFGRSRHEKQSDPRPLKRVQRQSQAGGGSSGARSPSGSRGTAGATPAPVPTVVKRWFKKLSHSDAQHPPTTASNITGVLRFAQHGHPIDQTTYFRRDFFDALAWAGQQTDRGLRETAPLTPEVIISGMSLGQRSLEVSHAAWREENQNNVTTALHWHGMASELRQQDHTGEWVVIERLSDGRFRLEVTPTRPGPFMP